MNQEKCKNCENLENGSIIKLDKDGNCPFCNRNISRFYTSPKEEIINDWEKEEWGGWKIISDMLDNPDENGIYNTSEAYKKLYDFVVEQKQKAISSTEKRVAKETIEQIVKTVKGLKDSYYTDNPSKGVCETIIGIIKSKYE